MKTKLNFVVKMTQVVTLKMFLNLILVGQLSKTLGNCRNLEAFFLYIYI